MANRKLQITDHERKVRRAMQVRRSAYKCANCGVKAQAKPGTGLVCLKCLEALLMPPSEQMQLFSFGQLFPGTVMEESRPLVLVLKAS